MDRCRDDEEESGKDRSKQQRERDTCDTDTCAEVVHHHHADRSSDDEKDFKGQLQGQYSKGTESDVQVGS